MFPNLLLTFRKESPGTPDSGADVKQVLPEGEKGTEFRDTESLRAHSSAVLGRVGSLPHSRGLCAPLGLPWARLQPDTQGRALLSCFLQLPRGSLPMCRSQTAEMKSGVGCSQASCVSHQGSQEDSQKNSPFPSLIRASGLTNSCVWVVVLRFIPFYLPCMLCVFLPKLLLFWSLQDPLNSSKGSHGLCPLLVRVGKAEMCVNESTWDGDSGLGLVFYWLQNCLFHIKPAKTEFCISRQSRGLVCWPGAWLFRVAEFPPQEMGSPLILEVC